LCLAPSSLTKNQDFLPKLKDHILNRISNTPFDGDTQSFSDEARSRLVFKHNRIHEHPAVRLNFTTYDVRRDQDYVNWKTSHRDVMVQAAENERISQAHPFWYARVVRVFHVDFIRTEEFIPRPERMDILWVRWFKRDTAIRSGWKSRRLDRVSFETGPDALGFLDPANAIRGCHLIPAFAHGRTQRVLGPSIARDEEGDWRYFYVNR
jgi:hypothetical protein